MVNNEKIAEVILTAHFKVITIKVQYRTAGNIGGN